VDPALRPRLVEIVGAGAVDAARGSVVPASVEQVARVCRLCAETGRRLAVTSGPATQGAAATGGILVSLARLDTLEVNAPALVVRAGAGAAVAALHQAVQAAGLVLAAPPPQDAAPGHVGSLVALGAVSRRALCGVEAVLPTGERVHSGGSVLKDVAGYDLAGVLLGSAGRLALIVAASFRLLPRGERPPSPDPAGTIAAGRLSDLVRTAFDPDGLLQSPVTV